MRIQVLQYDTLPVGVVRDAAKLREGPLRGADDALGSGQQVTKIDDEPAVALPLVRWQDHQAGEVVPLVAAHFAEVAHKMAAISVVPGHDVKLEQIGLSERALTLQEELRQQAQVLAVDLALVTLDLKIKSKNRSKLRLILPKGMTGWIVTSNTDRSSHRYTSSPGGCLHWHLARCQSRSRWLFTNTRQNSQKKSFGKRAYSWENGLMNQVSIS